MDQGMDQTIRELRIQRYFKQVNWDHLKDVVKMNEI